MSYCIASSTLSYSGPGVEPFTLPHQPVHSVLNKLCYSETCSDLRSPATSPAALSSLSSRESCELRDKELQTRLSLAGWRGALIVPEHQRRRQAQHKRAQEFKASPVYGVSSRNPDSKT